MTAKSRAAQVLSRLPEGAVVGAEIGVFKAKMSALLLERPDLTLYMVDNWQPVAGLEDAGYGKHSQESNKLFAESSVQFAGGRAIIKHMNSVDAAETVDDGSLDFVFIDAGHDYDSVKSDINAWFRKVKKGGLFGGHDYENPNEKFGHQVKLAVDEFADEYGQPFQICEGHTWFMRIKDK